MERLSKFPKVIKLGNPIVEIDVKHFTLMDYFRRDHRHLTVSIVTSHLRNNDTVVIAQSHLVRWGVF